MTNLEVFVQPPKNPRERRHVGWLTDGYKPTPDDYERWNIKRENVVDARIRKIGGQRCYLIVARDVIPTNGETT